MIEFNRYPHVKDFIGYYATVFSNADVEKILDKGIKSERDAELLSRFVWAMVEKMSLDSASGIEVFGQVDNSDVFPDIQYEVTRYLTKLGYIEAWNKVRDSVNN